MSDLRPKTYYYISSFFSTLIFIPIFTSSVIGSDWDSYALIGTYKNYLTSGVYFPSRPPGFPLYEFLIGSLIKYSGFLPITKEQLLIIFQLILLLSLNYLIYKFFNKTNSPNYLIYLTIVCSPIYLISGLSVIDYFLGSLFGFSAIYFLFYKKSINPLAISLLLTGAITTRLSNLIFLFVIVLYLYLNDENKRSAIIISIATLIFSSFVYFIFYENLFSFYKSTGVYENWSELLCLFNLTNTDHTAVGRLGRFVLKQVPYLGTVGAILLIVNVRKFKIDLRNKNFYLFLIFLLFELSFLRLPTEEGHLLPAFIAFMMLLTSSKKNLITVIFIAVLLSNFVDIKLYSVDKVDSASSINTSFELTDGFLIEDFNERNLKGEEKEFHYNNSQITLNTAWLSGCPN
jgi:hypothetical protein